MDFDFSDEQKMFQQQVRRALDAACPPQEVRRILESDMPFSDDAWEALVKIGATAAAIPEDHGGLGLGYYELCVAAQEAGRALAPTPLDSSIFLAAEMLMLAGSEAQKRLWLPKLAAGDAIGALIDGRAASGARLASARLSGRFAPAIDASRATFAIIALPPALAQPLVLVELDQPGATVTSATSIDPTRDIGELRLDDVAADPLGDIRSTVEAETLVLRVQQRAAILSAFEQVGGAERALAMARDYALERKTFGRQIGSYQAIKHKLADVYIRIEIARAHALYGAWALSTDAPDLPLAAAAARVSATEAFSLAAQENIQTHGGMGFTWESDCQLFYRRARFLALRLGNALAWKERIAETLVQTNSGAEAA